VRIARSSALGRRELPRSGIRPVKLALGLTLGLALLAPSFATAGSRAFSSGPPGEQCVGGGYTYKYATSTQAGTYHTQGSSCFKTVRMSFWSPDGTGWVERDWVTGWGATISDSIALSADARSYHEFFKSGYYGQAGYTCSWLPGAC
jgi:hypothetical protein